MVENSVLASTITERNINNTFLEWNLAVLFVFDNIQRWRTPFVNNRKRHYRTVQKG